MSTRTQVRLYALLARKSPRAVIFRRGPSRQVQLICWNTHNDTFEHGQWFKGRIYERRCDLSPNGDFLLYFAAKHQEPLYSWTAISRPPYFTALALWPKGDCWGGGGLFVSRREIELNHPGSQMTLAEGFSVPRMLRVRPLGEHAGAGECFPPWSARLQRDGWTLTEYPTGTKDERGSEVMVEYSPPITWSKPNPKWPNRYSLEMSVLGIYEKNGPWYITENAVIRDGKDLDPLGRTEWADWAHNGDLLFSREGSLHRAECRSGELVSGDQATKIADFTDHKFAPLAAPSEYQRWPKI